MKTTPAIIASLRFRLKREPTFVEIDAERKRLSMQWYESLRLAMESIGQQEQ
jgi:hypothetical protein